MLAQVVARKFFEPLVWSEELARYVFIWVAFLGWIVATERRSHIAITQFIERTTPRLQQVAGLGRHGHAVTGWPGCSGSAQAGGEKPRRRDSDAVLTTRWSMRFCPSQRWRLASSHWAESGTDACGLLRSRASGATAGPAMTTLMLVILAVWFVLLLFSGRRSTR